MLHEALLLQLSMCSHAPTPERFPLRQLWNVFRTVRGTLTQRRMVMDDRRLQLHIPTTPHVVRTSEFSRLGKALLASTYERVVPIARVTLGGGNLLPTPIAGPPTAIRKVGA